MIGPYDNIEPDDVDDPGFDPAEYWNDICSPDYEDEDEYDDC